MSAVFCSMGKKPLISQSDDDRIADAQRTIKTLEDRQPVQSGRGALTGGIVAESVAIGAFFGKLFGEMSREANRHGRSIFEGANHPGVMQELNARVASNPEALKRLTPYVLAMVAAPFIGAAAGAWSATRRGVKAIRRKQSLIEDLHGETNAHENGWHNIIEEKRSQPVSHEKESGRVR